MKKMLIALCALALISVAASAQLSPSARGTAAQPSTPTAPAACSPCLWYSGDTDASNPNWDALANYNAPFLGLTAQVWVPVIAASDGNPADKLVLVSAITFNEVIYTGNSNPPPDFGGMTYAFRTGVSAGNGGTLGKNGTCNATSVVATGLTPYGYTEYAFTCYPKKFAVKLNVGQIYWVNLLPTFTTSTYNVFLDDAIDVPNASQLGWSDDFYNSFFDSAYFGSSFVPATSVGPGAQEFSVSIAGTYLP